MDIQEIKKLLEMFDKSSSVKLKITNDNFEISLEKSSAKSPKIAPPQNLESVAAPSAPQIAKDSQKITQDSPSLEPGKKNENTQTILSPMVGTFYRAPSPDSPPYVNVGDKVKKGQTIAIIEAMKIMNEIEAEFDCKIVEIIVSDAQSVEFSTELFVVEKI